MEFVERSGVVKSVVSGDTVVLMGRANNGPPPEIQLTLSSLIAPRFGTFNNSVSDAAAASRSRGAREQ